MEKFEKDLLSVCKGSGVAKAILVGMTVIFLLLGLGTGSAEYEQFDPTKDSYASLNVVYVMGPFAERTENGGTTDEYYIAEADDGCWYIIGTDTKSSLPVYGEDVADVGIKNLKSQTVKGKSTEIPSDLASHVVDFLQAAGYDISPDDYAQYFGDHYLDTTVNASDDAIVYYLVTALLAVITIIVFISSAKKKKVIKAQLALLEQNGQLARLYQDFSIGHHILAKKLRLAVSEHYVLDFQVPKEGFQVIPLEHVNRAFKCNMVQGEPTEENYIALETTEGERILIGRTLKVNKEFEKVLAQLKQSAARTDGGAAW